MGQCKVSKCIQEQVSTPEPAPDTKEVRRREFLTDAPGAVEAVQGSSTSIKDHSRRRREEDDDDSIQPRALSAETQRNSSRTKFKRYYTSKGMDDSNEESSSSFLRDNIDSSWCMMNMSTSEAQIAGE